MNMCSLEILIACNATLLFIPSLAKHTVFLLNLAKTRLKNTLNSNQKFSILCDTAY